MTEKILSVRGLNKSFKHKQVLFDVNFDCQAGRIVALVGANGAGKTTIMKAILGLIKSSGEVEIAGKRVSFNHSVSSSDVGALIEYPGIYPFLTGRQHLEMFAQDLTYLDQLVAKLKMTAYIDRPANKYSLGMKQKLGVALALINRPKFVILDEPMNGLDPQATRDLRNLIEEEAKKGTSFLISSHILAELQKFADDVVIVKYGRVVKNSTMAELLAQDQLLITLKTSDDKQARQVLAAADYKVLATPELKIVCQTEADVETALVLVQERGILIKNLFRNSGDLEKTVLDLIER